ncbi:MAG TPA: hypothetical protein VG407_07415 [Caulobacteraceae bacterium]|jgi:hypothetical protein|nr:hypothetical protein [Caulobacteraceae bacterium]
MKIIHLDEIPRTASPRARGGSGHSSQVMFDSDILGRDPDAPDNFFAQLSHVSEGEFHAPRHRHDFEQFRFMLHGEARFREGKMVDGVLGYFPEGAYYGPQDKTQGSVLIVQFGGASGNGFVDRKVMKVAMAEMKALNTGVFEDGVYRRNPGVEGKPVQDGNEAIFEYIRKRPVIYPKPQYLCPIMIDSNAIAALPAEGLPGVEERSLGTFSSTRIRAARYTLAPEASLPVSERGIYFVLAGAGQLDSEPYRLLTALYLEDGEQARFTATDESDILYLGLPRRSRISAAVLTREQADEDEEAEAFG